MPATVATDASAAAGRPAGLRLLSLGLLLGLAAVLAVRVATLPSGPWEQDEVLFVRGVERFAPAEHRPHPPGYPLLIGLGKALAVVVGDPFRSLVILSVVSSAVGYVALAWAFRELAIRCGAAAVADAVGVTGALLFHFSPAMLVYGPLALSDPPALMFLSLMLLGAARPAWLRERHADLLLGGSAAAALGCRPQLLAAVFAALLAALWLAPSWRSRALTVAASVVVGLGWLVPLAWACGGARELVAVLQKQAGSFEQFDAAMPRAGGSAATLGWIATRFLAHPWGTRLTALPVLLLALGGLGIAARSGLRGALPLLALTGTELAICLFALNPHDAVRYALPSMLGLAWLAAIGLCVSSLRLRAPRAAYGVALLLAAGFVGYAAPLLAVRTRQASPAMAAVAWAGGNVPANAAVLVETSLEPFASEYLSRFELALAGPGLDRFALRQEVPLWLYADGPSSWPGAVHFSWPDSDPYGKLTRGVLRVVSLSPVPASLRQSRALAGVHVHEPTLRASRYRWLGPRAVLELAPGGADAASLVLALPENVPWSSNRVAIEVNGAAVATVEVARGAANTQRLPLPAAERVEVTVAAERSFVAAEAGLGADRRELAVQLLELRLAPPNSLESPEP